MEAEAQENTKNVVKDTSKDLTLQIDKPSKGLKRIRDERVSRSSYSKSGENEGEPETNKKTLPVKLNELIGSSNLLCAPKVYRTDIPYGEAMETLDRLVDNGLLEGGSKVWCRAVTALYRKEKRNIFMTIKED